MLVGNSPLPDNLGIRPARPEDKGFIESLYRSTRDDLRLIDAETDFIEELIGMQQRAQGQGYGEMFPNAMYFVVEHLNERIGRIVVDFGPNEIRLVDLAFVPQARGRGFGVTVIKAMQFAAGQSRAPLTLAVNRTNVRARQLYLSLGFRVEQSDVMTEYMAWYPTAVFMQ